jgi:hypothetical protein
LEAFINPSNSRVATVGDDEVRAVIDRVGLIGGIDQWADSTDVLDRADLCRWAAVLYNGV